jgi:hypothetical protein
MIGMFTLLMRETIVNNFSCQLSDHLFGSVDPIHYLCIDNVREMSGWGNNTSWSVDSDLPYIIYKDPPC